MGYSNVQTARAAGFYFVQLGADIVELTLGGLTWEELADVVIAQVQPEPIEPSGLGMRRIIAGLFQQVAEKATEIERARCLAPPYWKTPVD
jgi:hypothetical protein